MTASATAFSSGAAALPRSPTVAGSAVPAVSCQSLTFVYPDRRQRPATSTPPPAALSDIGFDVRVGELFGVLGPNGSGKTTLFRLLATVLSATAISRGHAWIFGHDLADEPDAVRRRLGVVFQRPSLDGELTAIENLGHHGHLYGWRGAALRSRVRELLEQAELSDRADDRVATFSGGMRRRLELAKALLPRPALLLLDEPSSGLDPAARRDFWRRLEHARARDGATILLTTHLMDEADRCDRLAILNRGRLIAIDTPAALKTMVGGRVVELRMDPSVPAETRTGLVNRLKDGFGPWKPGAEPRAVDDAIRFEHPDGARLIPEVESIVGDAATSVSVGRPTLEDVFYHLTSQSFDGEAASPSRDSVS